MHLDKHGLLSQAQKALTKSTWGCTHAHLIDRAIVRQAKAGKKKAMAIGWIDYAKAFDSVPQGYIARVLKDCGINLNVIQPF